MLTLFVAVFAITSVVARSHQPPLAPSTSSAAALGIIVRLLLICCILHNLAQEVRTASDDRGGSTQESTTRTASAGLLELCCMVAVGVTGMLLTLKNAAIMQTASEERTEVRKDWNSFIEGSEKYERQRSGVVQG